VRALSLVGVVFGLLLASPAEVRAQGGACASVFDCFCFADAQAVVTGEIVSTNGSMVQIEVTSIEPVDATLGYSVGDEIQGNGYDLEVGDAVWMVARESQLPTAQRIVDGGVDCNAYADDVPMQLATDGALSDACSATLKAGGVDDPPCGEITDERPSSDSGCHLSPTPASDPALGKLAAVLALGLAAARRRRGRFIFRSGCDRASKCPK
jgi:hypothetical protein